MCKTSNFLWQIQLRLCGYFITNPNVSCLLFLYILRLPSATKNVYVSLGAAVSLLLIYWDLHMFLSGTWWVNNERRKTENEEWSIFQFKQHVEMFIIMDWIYSSEE